MRSSDRSSFLDLERDLPTTPEDVAALRRARALHRLDLEGYLQLLGQIPQPTFADLRSKPGPRDGDTPFELTD